MLVQGFLWNGSPIERIPSKRAGDHSCLQTWVDKGGGWRSPRNVTGLDNPQCPSDPLEIMA
jgi:hypothetical protein